MARKRHVLCRVIRKDAKGLFITYGGFRIRYKKQSKFSEGDEVEVHMDLSSFNIFRVTTGHSYFERWRVATQYEKNRFIRTITIDKNGGMYIRFQKKIFRPEPESVCESKKWRWTVTVYPIKGEPDKIEVNFIPSWKNEKWVKVN